MEGFERVDFHSRWVNKTWISLLGLERVKIGPHTQSPPAAPLGAAGGLSLSRNPDCNQEQTGSRTYMSEKTAKRNEDNRSLHFHVANFFKFMAANLSFTQFVT